MDVTEYVTDGPVGLRTTNDAGCAVTVSGTTSVSSGASAMVMTVASDWTKSPPVLTLTAIGRMSVPDVSDPSLSAPIECEPSASVPCAMTLTAPCMSR